MSTHTTNGIASPSISARFLDDLRHETEELTKSGWEAFKSFAWLWPLRGLFFTVQRT